MLNKVQDYENNKKLLRGVQGGGFLEKSPLAAGGKVITRSNYTSGSAA